jgi:hypothetical protein
MEKTEQIVNRVALSPLITVDLADYHDRRERVILDIAPQLYMGLILREQPFRDWIAAEDWSQYRDCHVVLTNSVDAIIPGWAWMLLAIHLEPFAATIVFGSMQDLEKEIWRKNLDKIDYNSLQGKKIVVKGCGDIAIPDTTYVEFIRRLRPLADKLMYGEPCSTVPLYKKSKTSPQL